VQIVGYETLEPALLVAEDGGVRRESLSAGTALTYGLGERHCAGVLHDGEHRSCDAPEAPYCRDHSYTWVCARCTGDCLKDEMDCYDDHAVYLAGFAPDVVKVGVTKAWRLETRLREQGADRGAHLRTVENGRIAREIEAGLAETLTDRVRVPTKLAGLSRGVDEAAWDAALEGFEPIDTFRFDYDLDLTDQPVAETIASGTVRGTKGRILVLESGGTAYGVDMRDLVGHEVLPGGTDRDLQSSLGAFG
jgi:hypothetical protein